MEHSVKLEAISPSVVFPDRLRERMAYDPVKGRLSYCGFMTKCTYDELAALDADPYYRRALEELFVLTSAEVSPRTKGRSFVGAILAISVAAAVLATAVICWTLMHRSAGSPADSMAGTNVSTAS